VTSRPRWDILQRAKGNQSPGLGTVSCVGGSRVGRTVEGKSELHNSLDKIGLDFDHCPELVAKCPPYGLEPLYAVLLNNICG
jgi:hypothetical protein